MFVVESVHIGQTLGFQVTAIDLQGERSPASNVSVLIDSTAALPLELQIADATVSETGSTIGTVTRQGTIGDLVVQLFADPPGEITLPFEVTILDGETSATFPISGINDGVYDGSKASWIAAAAPGYGADVHPQPNDVVAYYDFADGKATNHVSGVAGPVTGITAYVKVDDEFGHVLRTGGESGNLNTQNTTLGDNDAEYSVAFWVKPEVMPNGETRLLTNKRDTWDDELFMISLASSGQIYYQMNYGKWASDQRYSVGSLTEGEWSHVALVREGSQVHLYIDGQLDSSLSVTASTGSNDGSVMLGAANTGSNYRYAPAEAAFDAPSQPTPREARS